MISACRAFTFRSGLDQKSPENEVKIEVGFGIFFFNRFLMDFGKLFGSKIDPKTVKKNDLQQFAKNTKSGPGEMSE